MHVKQLLAPATMSGIIVEEQTVYNAARSLYGAGIPIAGQRLSIPNRKIFTLSFVLEKINSPVGDIHYVIARTFDNVELFRQYLCDANMIAGGANWYEKKLTPQPTINDEVTIYVEYLGGDAANHIDIHYQNTNVKHNGYNEYFRENPACWYEHETQDCAYKYRYRTMGAPAVVYSIEQLCRNHGMLFGDATTTRLGQRLTIPNRTITHLGFWIWKIANPVGDITFGIRRVSDDGLICSKVWGDASALQIAATYEEVEFDTPITINEEVRIYAEFLNGDAVDKTGIGDQNTNVKGNEGLTYYAVGAWQDFYVPTRDCTYRMKNLLP